MVLPYINMNPPQVCTCSPSWTLLPPSSQYRPCGRGRGWDNLGEWHWNMYNIIYEMICQSRFDAWYWMLGAGALKLFFNDRIVTRFSVFKNCSYVLKQGTSLVAQIIENLPSVQEAWVRSLVWEGTLEKEMATHSRILAWRIPKRRKTRWLKKILDILHSMWAPNSPTRDITCVPCTGNRVLTTGPPGKFQWDHFFLLNFCTVRMQSASVPNVNARCVSVYAQESN